jgi:hypothetical protein
LDFWHLRFSPLVTERFIHHLRVERPPASETAVEARARLGALFPRASLRRMTHLGLLLGATLDGVDLGAEDAVVYATTFAETRALEDFLGSFPAASPLSFQTSIHPGGVQQVLIGRQRPIARLWPLAGRARLVEQALLTALLESARRVVLCGGEERGTWLLECGMASERAFAFAFELSSEPTGAIARVRLAGSEGGTPALPDEPCPLLPDFVDALAERRPLAWRGAGGAWSIDWS